MIRPDRLTPRPAAARGVSWHRWPYAFGSRIFVLFAVGLVWVAPAWVDARFLYAMAAWDLLLIAAWMYDCTRLPPPEQLEVRRTWTAPLGLFAVSHVQLEVRSHADIPLEVSVLDDMSTTLRPAPFEHELSLPARGIARVSYDVQPRERGDIPVGFVFLRYQARFKIAERWARAEVGQRVRVYPNLAEARHHALYLIRSRQLTLEKRLNRRRGLGREFESLREYRSGDEPRAICWTATARRAKLISKIYQIERSQAVWIIVDAGRLLRARVGPLTKLDHAVSAALSLAHVALESGDRVGLFAYGRKPQQRLSPDRGGVHLRVLVEQLAQVRAEPFEADHAHAAERLLTDQKQRSLMVWLTDLADMTGVPEVIESAARMTRRHLVLLAVIGQPELGELASRYPETEPEMYRAIAAQEVVLRRDLLLRTLRQQGALALELGPQILSTSLVNQYLEVKERSLI